MPAKGADLTSTTTSSDARLTVVGGGIIGLAIALRAQEAGRDVVVLDRGLDDGAWRVAAGMLAPVSEAEFANPELLELGLASARAWPAFAEQLGVPLHTAGTLHVARDRDEAEALEREAAFRERLELPVERLLPSRARRLEPALAPTIRAALSVPTDLAVDPRAVVAALRERVRVERRTVTDLAELDGDVVLAAGAWTAELADVPVRPVKGQVLHLRDHGHRDDAPLVTRVLRFEGGYLVPRGDGRYVLGATVEERGFDTTVTAGGLHELLRDATEIVPGISELVVEEALAGLRPGSPGNLPIVRREGRVVIATGHFRNGVLLAPATADRAVGLLAGVPA